ncbi:MAG: 50S ribosomal protein L10 [Candidatus Omnitrophica bacterium]|nr:50S ribosomal protein L10 [Candidatus Omnitrophota bacterium]
MAKVGRLVKETMVQELTAQLRDRPGFFVASVGRLTAVDSDTLRKRLRSTRSTMLVVKRALGRQGIAALKLDGLDELLSGSVALILPGEELAPVAKLLVDFAKADQEKLSLKGGWVEGQLLDQKRLEELAGLPPKPQLAAQLIFAIEAPLADLVMTLEVSLSELVFVLEEAAKRKPSEGQSGPGAAPPVAPSAGAAA